MPLPPLVSIVIPVHNDEDTIATALTSATAQTLEQIEIIVVDDDSSDQTPIIVQTAAESDNRIRLVRFTENRSAFQARRTGINEANAPFVMFLDGDDELEEQAAATASTLALSTEADMVQFGISLFWANAAGRTNSAFERRLQPKHKTLQGEGIVLGLFPSEQPAGGQLWKYLFRTEILREAYALLPSDVKIFRANDLPVAFLSAAISKRFASTPQKLYRYHFQRGASGHQVTSLEQVEFQMMALESVEVIQSAVSELAYFRAEPQALVDSYSSALRSVIANVLRYLTNIDDHRLKTDAIHLLEKRTSKLDVVRAAAVFQPKLLDELPEYLEPVALNERGIRSVLLTTSKLTTGGVSSVLLTQARLFVKAGYRVTIVAQRAGSDQSLVPAGVSFYQVSGKNIAHRLDHWSEICRDEKIDVVIEHRIPYSRQWNFYALMARAEGVSTIGWVHCFAGRQIYELNSMTSFIDRNMPILSRLVVLSPLDVTFWKLRGMDRTSFLPNPPSPLLLENGVVDTPRVLPDSKIRLVWLGRLDQHTKQVLSVLDVAEQLAKLKQDFEIVVVGPEWPGMTIEKFNAEASGRGLDNYVTAVGPCVGDSLLELLDSAHGYLVTSVIEGYQLTLVEAQSRGLPVFMYEMPWLLPVQNNRGIVTAPQGESAALARSIQEVFVDAQQYARLSQGAIDAAYRAIEFDFSNLYEQLIHGHLPDSFSPEPTFRDASEILKWTTFFAERNAGIRRELEESSQSVRTLRRRLSTVRKEKAAAVAASEKLRKVNTRLKQAGASQAPQNVASTVPAKTSVGQKSKGRIHLPGAARARRLLRRGTRLVSRRSSPPIDKAQRVSDQPSSTPTGVSIDRAELFDWNLHTVLSPDSRGVPTSLEAVREVNGVFERHAFELQVVRGGSIQGILDYSVLDHRRWEIRALYGTDNIDSSVIVPFSPDAIQKNEGPHRARTFNGTVIQIVDN